MLINISNLTRLFDRIYLNNNEIYKDKVFIATERNPIDENRFETIDNSILLDHKFLCLKEQSNGYIFRDKPLYSILTYNLIINFINLIVRNNVENNYLLYRDDFGISDTSLVTITENCTFESIVEDYLKDIEFKFGISYSKSSIEHIIKELNNHFKIIYNFYENENNSKYILIVEDLLTGIYLHTENIYEARYKEMLNAKRNTN